MSVHNANTTVLSGCLRQVQHFYQVHKTLPDTRGANFAARCGYLHILKYLNSFGVEPDKMGACWAAEKGYFKTLFYVLPRITDLSGVSDSALAGGHINLVRRLHCKFGLVPTSVGATRAFVNQNMAAVKFAQSQFKVYPIGEETIFIPKSR